jgi:hypothetical protein
VTAPPPDVAASTRQLRAALDRIATALTSADLSTLLAAEADLELALRRLASLPPGLTSSDRENVRLEIRNARASLQRCRALGGVLLDVVRVSLDAQGRGPGYGREADPAAGYARRAVDTRG